MSLLIRLRRSLNELPFAAPTIVNKVCRSQTEAMWIVFGHRDGCTFKQRFEEDIWTIFGHRNGWQWKQRYEERQSGSFFILEPALVPGTKLLSFRDNWKERLNGFISEISQACSRLQTRKNPMKISRSRKSTNSSNDYHSRRYLNGSTHLRLSISYHRSCHVQLHPTWTRWKATPQRSNRPRNNFLFCYYFAFRIISDNYIYTDKLQKIIFT